MGNVKKWKRSKVEDGVCKVDLDSWEDFHDYICSEMLDYRHFVWRGQASESWLLEPTLDRVFKRSGKADNVKERKLHLDRFKYATRGRRGINPPNLKEDNEWWALGQHNFLATPLLDWSTSPFVAAYFAFETLENDGAERRVVFGISKDTFILESNKIAKKWAQKDRPPIIEFIEPLTDENARLVNQGGLFTRAPDGIDIETWARQTFKDDSKYIRFLKITIPNQDREKSLRALNRMNINHLSLFPDLYGACKFVNLDLEIDKY